MQLLVFMPLFINAQTLDWAFSSGHFPSNIIPKPNYGVRGMVSDSSGNIYVTILYADTVDIAPLNSPNLIFDGTGTYPGLLASYTSSGNLIWAFKTPTVNSLVIDNNGDLVVSGFFYQSKPDFDPSANSFYLNDSIDVHFIAKYSSAGQLKWAKSIPNVQSFNRTNIGLTGIDKSGNIYTTYYGQSGTTFPMNHVCFSKHDVNGNILWSKVLSGHFYCNEYYVDCDVVKLLPDEHGNLYLVLTAFDSFGFDPSNPGYMLPINSSDAFIAKYNSLGNFIWVKQIKADYEVRIQNINLTNNGNIIVSGYGTDSSYFDDTNPTSVVGSNNIPYQFVAKYDTAGHFAWVNTIYGSIGNNAVVCGINTGNINLINSFTGDIYLNNPNGLPWITANGNSDMLIETIGDDGNIIGGIHVGGSNQIMNPTCGVISGDNLIVGGETTGSIDFDPTSLVQTSAYSSGFAFFMASYGLNTSLDFEVEDEMELKVWPSITNAIINVEYPKNHNGGLMLIYNGLGQLLISSELILGETHQHFNVSSLKPGVYNIKYLPNRGKPSHSRFIKI